MVMIEKSALIHLLALGRAMQESRKHDKREDSDFELAIDGAVYLAEKALEFAASTRG